MCNDESCFADYVQLDKPQKMFLGDGHHLHAIGRGSVYLEWSNDGKKKCKLNDVHCVPFLK